MSVMRAGLLAVLVGTAAVGAAQHSKPGRDSSTGWTAERPGPSAGENPGKRTRRANPGAGRRDRWDRRPTGTEWVDEWQAGWSRKRRAGQDPWRAGEHDRTHAGNRTYGGPRSGGSRPRDGVYGG
ncbi:hypothetical protein ACFQ08_30420, partial [Streptosporangium algeriense]